MAYGKSGDKDAGREVNLKRPRTSGSAKSERDGRGGSYRVRKSTGKYAECRTVAGATGR